MNKMDNTTTSSKIKLITSVIVIISFLSPLNLMAQEASDFFGYRLNDFWIYSLHNSPDGSITDIEKFLVTDTTTTKDGFRLTIIKTSFFDQDVDTIFYVIKDDSSVSTNHLNNQIFYDADIDNEHLIYNSSVDSVYNDDGFWIGGKFEPESIALYILKEVSTKFIFGKERTVRVINIGVVEDTTDFSKRVEHTGFTLAEEIGIINVISYEAFGGPSYNGINNMRGGVINGEVFGDTTFLFPVSSKPLTSIPTRFEITNNYPNPFNPGTTFHINLAKASLVSIDVYAVNGAKIFNVLNRYMSEGNHRVVIDFSQKTELHSGMYLVRFKNEASTVIKKVTLIK